MKSGASLGAALGALAVLALLALGIGWWFVRDTPRVDIAAVKPEGAAANRNAATHGDDKPLEARLESPSTPTARPPAVFPTEVFDAKRYEGVAHLRVIASMKSGQPMPTSWSLVFEPSKVLIGGERAVARRYDFAHGEKQIDIDDIALGGYEIRAESPGLCSMPQQLLLAKPDSVEVVATVEFYPAGYISGRVIDTESRPVDGIPMVLEHVATHSRRTALADPAGAYVFETVADGDYVLMAGSAESPLAPAREVAFLAPSLHMPDIVVPVLGEVGVRVLDHAGKPVADARVEGYGSAGGRIALACDADGRAVARFLPVGAIHFTASNAQGATGRAQFDLQPGARGEVEIRLRD